MSLLRGHYTGLQDEPEPTLDDLRVRLRCEREAVELPGHLLSAEGSEIPAVTRPPAPRGMVTRTLTDRQRRAMDLRERGLSLKEVGEAMGITWRAASMHLSRGRAYLREQA